jgi:NAD(P)-dependent dehydrogenase (short-subunit alcohol dehydrogenase family)
MALLNRKVALITGAATGIGESIARTFASEGSRVAIFDRDGAGAEEVAADIRANGGGVACRGDAEKKIATREQVDAVVALQCLRRRIVPLDVARVCVFLASELSDGMTGQTVNVDGGWVMY